jgi:endonuclease III
MASVAGMRRRPSSVLIDRARAIATELRRQYGDAQCALDHTSPLQLLLATILSAQCTDERVNQVTPALFTRFPTAAAIAASAPGEVEAIIRPTGFFNAKARHLRGCCQALVDRHGGEVPRTMEELLLLPGVARKTANVVLGTAYRIAAGVVVDTHVLRITRLLGLTRQTTPEKIERDLIALLPESEWIDFSHRLIWHGRKVCIARRPQCHACTLAPWCDHAAKLARGATQPRPKPQRAPAAPRSSR